MKFSQVFATVGAGECAWKFSYMFPTGNTDGRAGI